MTTSDGTRAWSAWAPAVAWCVVVITLAVVIATATLTFLDRASIHSIDDANLIEIILPIGFTLVGGLVASRMPTNAMGWVFLAISLTQAIPGLGDQYTRYALITAPGTPFSPWIPWFGSLLNSLIYPAGLATLVLLLIPTGRFLTSRWGWVAAAGAAITAVTVVVGQLDADSFAMNGVSRQDPTGIAALRGVMNGPIGAVLFFGGLGVFLAAGVSVILRLRRAHGEERLQLRWVVYATLFSVVIQVVATLATVFIGFNDVTSLLSPLATIIGFGFALPASFGVAILRYRLYDLDLLVNRTVVYGAVTVVLAAMFGIVDITAQRLFESAFSQRSDLISGGLGVGAALAFGPVRRRVRPVVDRFLPPRGRLTLLFTDIVGSTQAIVDLGDERWRDVLDRYRTVIRQELSRHRGREVNTAGDAFFATFDRPLAAVDCARSIRSSVRRLGLGVRTGLHMGDVEMRGEQVSGLAVHAAARVMAEASEDEILVSSDLAKVLHSDAALRDAGTHELKGVPGTWQLYRVDS